MTPETPILQVKDLVKAFGGLRALDGCSLEVAPRTITGLIGPNGAGKSTLFNTIMGLYAPDAGEILFSGGREGGIISRGVDSLRWLSQRSVQASWFVNHVALILRRAEQLGLLNPDAMRVLRSGNRVAGIPPWNIVNRGLVKTFQIPRELGNMTVLENLLLWVHGNPGERLWNLVLHPLLVRKFERGAQRKAEEILRFVGLFDLRNEYAKNLSGGQKKILELARALMADPTMILLDEPVAGVNPILTAKILDLIAQLRDQGKTFFLIEHDMDVVMNRCDWIIVMHQGRRLAEGNPKDVKLDDRVVEAYLGS